MSTIKEVVSSTLRSSESAILVIETAPDRTSSNLSANAAVVLYRSKLVAIVIHEDHGQRHSALFVYEWVRSDQPSLKLSSALAISPLLEISLVRLNSTGTPVSKDEISAPPIRQDYFVDIRSEGKEISFICNEGDARILETEIKALQELEIISRLRHPQDLRLLHHGPALSSAFAGETGDEDVDELLIREDWIRKQLRARQDEYSTCHELRIRAGTFNVNGKLPDASIRSWVQGHPLSSESLNYHSNYPDIYLFGFQELDLSAAALLYSTSTTLEDQWTAAIIEALADKAGSYIKFASRQLVGMLILGFVLKKKRPYISEISTSSLGIGILGLMGNKGAVGLRFRYRDSVICVVVSHLAANDGLAEKRDFDYLQISQRLHFPLNAATPAEAADQSQSVSTSIFESNALIWMGDLNYRLDLPHEEIMHLLEPSRPYNLVALMEYDELSSSKRKKTAFELFQESHILFDPTYRYLVDSSSYDARRKPAWTDRILHVSYPPSSLKQISYSSHSDVLLSDHKPVSADFSFQARDMNLGQHSKIAADVLRSATSTKGGKFSTPKILLSTQQLYLGDVRYLEKITRTVELTNATSNPITFRFISCEEERPIAPAWLTIDTEYGLILPQETIQIVFTVLVEDTVAALLNRGAEPMDATLIIHPEHGVDTFMLVSGHFMPTCFARSLDSLSRCPAPVREYDGTSSLDEGKAATVPKELMRIIEWLMAHPLDGHPERLFAVVSPPDLLLQIREALDTGEEFSFDGHPSWQPDIVTLAFGQTLVQFLSSLTEPIVSPDAYDVISGQQEDNHTEVLEVIPRTNVNVWVTLFAFLQYECIRSEKHISRLDMAERIAAIFAPILLPNRDSSEIILTPLQKRRFIMQFMMQ